MRRWWITLISAGRNRTIVIRRELPLTNAAGWVKTPSRIKDRRAFLSGHSVNQARVVNYADDFVILSSGHAAEDPDRLSYLHAVRVIRRKLPRAVAIPHSAKKHIS
jgi:hypothetical protein